MRRLARKVLEADAASGLASDEVKTELADFAGKIADSKEAVLDQEAATHEAATQLRNIITMSPDLKKDQSHLQVGNLINERTGDFVDPADFIRRHRAIQKGFALEGVSA